MARTVADVLNEAAEYLTQPGRWTQGVFIQLGPSVTTDCRCAAGAVAYVVAPFDLDGNPMDLRTGYREVADLGQKAATFLAEHLIDHHDAARCSFGDDELHPMELDVIETISNWNDDPRRTQSEVVSALRDAAADWRSRFERTAA